MDQLDGLGKTAAVLLDHHGECGELLTQRHRYRVLQLCTAHLEHVTELDGLTGERVLEYGHRLEQSTYREDRRHLDGRRVDVIGRLAEVDVLVGVQMRVLPLGVAEQFQRAVRHDLVGVHVGGGAGTALDDVHDELVVQFAGPDLPADGDDRGRLLGRQQPEFLVGESGGLLHGGQGVDQMRVGGDRRAGDGEVLRRAQGVDTPVRVGGHIAVAEQIVFAAGGGGHEGSVPLPEVRRRERPRKGRGELRDGPRRTRGSGRPRQRSATRRQ